MISKTKEHLNSVNESYITHMTIALKIGFTMIFYGLIAILHAIIPAYFQTSASDKIKSLNDFIQNRWKFSLLTLFTPVKNSDNSTIKWYIQPEASDNV